MRRVQASLAIATALLAVACAPEDRVPDGYVAAEQADLSGARLPAELAAAAELPLTDADLSGGRLFVSGDVDEPDAMLDVAAAGAPDARFGRDVLVAVRWGYFPARPASASAWTDWSGFVAVSRGRVEVVRPLRFENDGAAPRRPVEDFVRPDGDPRLVRFRSHTAPAWDGLLLRVHRPSLAPAVLVIRVGDVTRVLPFEELFDLDAAEVVDLAGHELRIRARTPAPPACLEIVAEGGGTWDASDADHGLFEGSIAGDLRTVELVGRTLDVVGPYGRYRGRLLEDGAELGRTRGFYAAFHYTPGSGRFVGVARGGGGDAHGGLIGRWALDPGATTGDFDARLIQRGSCGDDAE